MTITRSRHSTWQPERYLTFAEQRARPALDLLARVPLANPTRIADLGCRTQPAVRPPLSAGRTDRCPAA
jgi:hypothetical protein